MQNDQDDSKPYQTYLCEYRFGRETWGIEVPAKSIEEAEARLRQIAHGKVLGTLEGSIAVSRRLPFVEAILNMATKSMNLFR